MNFSLSAFLFSPSSTSFMILEAVESSYSSTALSISVESPFTLPERTVSPAFTLRGTLSPVRALVSMKPSPSWTTASKAILSPLFALKTSPFLTSSGFVSFHSPSESTSTASPSKSRSLPMESLLLSVALSWKNSPTW